MLCLLEGELDQAVFNTLMSRFVAYWSAKEPDLVKQFEKCYTHRPGTSNISVLVLQPLPVHYFLQRNGYRLFEHGDTDTNMFLER